MNKLENGDVVMDDCGTTIDKEFAAKGVILDISSFRGGKSRLQVSHVDNSWKIAIVCFTESG